MKGITSNTDTKVKKRTIYMSQKKIYGFVTVGTKGQVVIPADAREALHIEPGDHLFVVGGEKKILALIPEASADHFIAELNKHVEDFEAIRARGPEESEDE